MARWCPGVNPKIDLPPKPAKQVIETIVIIPRSMCHDSSSSSIPFRAWGDCLLSSPDKCAQKFGAKVFLKIQLILVAVLSKTDC